MLLAPKLQAMCSADVMNTNLMNKNLSQNSNNQGNEKNKL